MVAHQGEPPAGELDPDLVAPSGVEPDADQAFFALGQPAEFQPGVLDTLALLLHGEDLVLPAVLEEEILPVAGLRGRAVDHGNIFLHHGTLLDGLGEGCSGVFVPGKHHDAAHVFIQPVDGEDLTAQLFFQGGGDLCFRIQAHGLDADRQIAVGIQQFHTDFSSLVRFYNYITPGQKRKCAVRKFVFLNLPGFVV